MSIKPGRPTAKLLVLPALFAVLLCGCSTTKFTPYHGTATFQGKGGASRLVDGVEFWEDGDSDRKYTVVGEIEVSRKGGEWSARMGRLLSNSDDQDSAIAKLARKQGGDAVIVVSTDHKSSDDNSGKTSHQQKSARFVVIKYLDQPR
jgi:hypothetical protein